MLLRPDLPERVCEILLKCLAPDPDDRYASAGELGYDLVIYPVTTLRIAMGAVTDALKTLKVDGHVENLLDKMQTRKELYELVGYTPGTAWEM